MTLTSAIEAAKEGLRYCVDRLQIEADAGRYPVSMITTSGGRGFAPLTHGLVAITALPEPKTEKEIFKMVYDAQWKKGCHIDLRSIIMFTIQELKVANVLFVKE